MPPRVVWPSVRANGSCDGEYPLKLGWDFLAVVNAVGGNAQSQRSDGGNRRPASWTVSHHSGHRFNVGPPTTVVFLPQSDRDRFRRGCFHRSCAPPSDIIDSRIRADPAAKGPASGSLPTGGSTRAPATCRQVFLHLATALTPALAPAASRWRTPSFPPRRGPDRPTA